MRFYTGLLIIVIPCYSYAQPDRWAVTLCPLAAIDGFSFPTIQAGLEWRFAGRFSWYNEFGVEYTPSRIDWSDTVILRPHGIKAKTELRYYFEPGHYFAFNAFLTSDAHNTEVPYTQNGDTAELTDAFGVHKTVLGWNLLWGREQRLGGRLFVEMYFGFGMRVRDIRTVDEQYNPELDNLITGIDVNIPAIRAETELRPGWSVVPNFTMGVRFQYRIGRLGDWERPHPRAHRRRSLRDPNLIHPPQM
jgi:hypothetical protein